MTTVFAKNDIKDKPYYGEDFSAANAVVLDKVIKDFTTYDNKQVVIKAKVKKVCESKGCWMTLVGPNSATRVKFKEYSFFVPLTLIDKFVWIHGAIKREQLSIEDTKHYLADAGASKEQIAKVTKPSFEYSIIAKGIKVVK